MSHGLGRRHAPDERDLNYPLKAVVPEVAPGITYRYWWTGGAWMDQGPTGTCVGHAWAHWVEDGPVTHLGTIDPILYYLDCTKVDEWPGNDSGDLNFGTSVRAGAKVGVARGLISEYRWGFDLEAMIRALLAPKEQGGGPVVVGVNWYAGFDDPDEKGFVSLTGRIRGGHAFTATGLNLNRELVRFKNSWGRAWGKDGHFWMSFADVSRLIREDGEICLAIEKASK